MRPLKLLISTGSATKKDPHFKADQRAKDRRAWGAERLGLLGGGKNLKTTVEGVWGPLRLRCGMDDGE